MERLTIDEIIEHCDRKTGMYEKFCDVKCLETAVMGNRIKEYWEHKQVSEYLRKLKDYEDAEKQGRLIKLPCKVGDTVYKIINQRDNYDDTVYQIVSSTIFELSMIDKIEKAVRSLLTSGISKEK